MVCPVASFTMKHAWLCSSIVQGDGKWRAGGPADDSAVRGGPLRARARPSTCFEITR